MNKTSLSEVLYDLITPFGETLWMVSWSFLFTIIFGLICGIGLRLTSPDGLTPKRIFNTVFGAIINLGRSIPYLVLMIVLIPVTRFIAGTSAGPTGAIFPLVVGATPFYARVAESAIREVSEGKIEAALVFGARVHQVIFKVLIPEALPSLISGATLTMVTLIGYATMAGALGGGGIGTYAIVHGYQRFDQVALYTSVVVLAILVQVLQMIGDRIVISMNHKK